MKNKAYIPEKKAGVWLDHEHAYVIQMNDDFECEVHTLYSTPLNPDIPGEKKASGLKRIFFNKDKQQRHEHQHMLKFFDCIIQQLGHTDYLYLFGPGSSKHEFNHLIEKSSKKYPFRVMAMESADKMPVHKMIEQVKAYFRSLVFEDAQRRLHHVN